MAPEISGFHLPKILFLSLQLELMAMHKDAHKNVKHKKLLNFLCIVYIRDVATSIIS